MILTGVVHTIFNSEPFGTSFKKRVLWLKEINSPRPNVWAIEFWNDEGNWLNKFSIGDLVNCNISVIGRMSSKNGTDRVFTTLRGLKIEKLKTS